MSRVGKSRKAGRAVRNAFVRLTLIDWAAINFKLALGLVWPLAFFGAEPESIVGALGLPFMALWLGLTVVGFMVSLTGLFMSAQTGETRRRGFRVEMVGLFIFAGGPLCYSVVNVILLLEGTPDTSRLSQLALSWALVAAVALRLFAVRAAAEKNLELFRTGK